MDRARAGRILSGPARCWPLLSIAAGTASKLLPLTGACLCFPTYVLRTSSHLPLPQQPPHDGAPGCKCRPGSWQLGASGCGWLSGRRPTEGPVKTELGWISLVGVVGERAARPWPMWRRRPIRGCWGTAQLITAHSVMGEVTCSERWAGAGSDWWSFGRGAAQELWEGRGRERTPPSPLASLVLAA